MPQPTNATNMKATKFRAEVWSIQDRKWSWVGPRATTAERAEQVRGNWERGGYKARVVPA